MTSGDQCLFPGAGELRPLWAQLPRADGSAVEPALRRLGEGRHRRRLRLLLHHHELHPGADR